MHLWKIGCDTNLSFDFYIIPLYSFHPPSELLFRWQILTDFLSSSADMRVTIAVLCLMWLCSCESRRLGRCDVVRIFRQEGLDGFEGFSLGNCGYFVICNFSTDLQCLAYLNWSWYILFPLVLNFISTDVCTAFWESRFKTERVRSADTGKDYGIFQINSFKWCNDGTPDGKNTCNVPCSGTLLPLNGFHVTKKHTEHYLY